MSLRIRELRAEDIERLLPHTVAAIEDWDLIQAEAALPMYAALSLAREDGASRHGPHEQHSKRTTVARVGDPSYTGFMESKAAQVARFCHNHHIEILYAFGSRAKQALSALRGSPAGPVNPHSDLDIGIRTSLDARIDVREKSLMALELEELFDVPRVDLVLLHEADPFLAANVIRGERLYVADAHAADEYELYVLRRAGDCAPLERERLALIEGS